MCVCVFFFAVLSSERRRPFFNVADSDGDAIARRFTAIHPLHLANSHAARTRDRQQKKRDEWKVNMSASHSSNSQEIIRFIR